MTPGYDLKDHKTGQKYEFPRESKKQRENTPRWREASKEQEIFQYVYNFNSLTTHLCSIWTFPMTWSVHMKTVLYMDVSVVLSINEDFGHIGYHCPASSCIILFIIIN